MPERATRKQQSLRQAGLLHAEPERVQDPLFLASPAFFDPHDQLQVRYEMRRSHLVESHEVVGICQRYGVSRQTFYNVQERFLSEGTAGLLAKKPGPKGPSKLTAEVRQFVEQQIQHEPHLSTTSLRSQLEEQFAVLFHRRTLEKFLKELRSKKKPPELSSPKEGRRAALNDIAAVRYEALRRAHPTTLCQRTGFSLHTEVCCAAHQRKRLEHLCRYITRPAIANERLKRNRAGQVVLQLKSPYHDGTTHIVMSPLEFMQRLAALVPRPRLHLIRFHGVLAPRPSKTPT